MKPERGESARTGVRIGGAARLGLAVERARVRRVVSVGADERIVRQRLATVQRHHRLAFGHHRGGEVVDDGRLARTRHPGAERRGAAATLDRSERRDDEAPAHVHHVDGRAVRLRGALRPVADAAEVTGVLERGDRHAVTARLRDTEVHRLLADRLTETVAAVDDREHLGLALDLDAPAGEDLAVLHPFHVAAGAKHAVRIVSAKIGAGEPPCDASGFHRIAAGVLEDAGHEALHRPGVDVDLSVRPANRGDGGGGHARASAIAPAHAAL